MASPAFEVTDYFELLALLRAIIEAKFASDAWDKHMPDNPHLAKLANRAVDTLIAMEDEGQKPLKGGNWSEWRRISQTNRPREWQVALDMVQKNRAWWLELNSDQRKEEIKQLFSPFILDADAISQFLQQANLPSNTT